MEPAAPVDDPLVGRMLRHFRVDAPLGRGGMGAVYRGWDTSLERPVAIKVLLSRGGRMGGPEDSPETRARFLREARLQAQIRHPHVVPIHFVGEDGGVAFLVMDLIEGETLAALLTRRSKLEPNRALEIADAVAQALEAGVERGLVHRDVKPSNILIDGRGHVLLADFGLAKQLGPADTPSPADPARIDPGVGPLEPTQPGDGPGGQGALTREGALIGTPAYAAPEQRGGSATDHRADVYALGVTLYEAVTGQVPFSAPTVPDLVEQHRSEPPLSPRLVCAELPVAVEQLVLRMLEKDPGHRFDTYASLRSAIAGALGRPLVPATAFVRWNALLADALLCGIVGSLASLFWEPLAAPFAAVALGLVEGRWGTTPGKRLMRLRTVGPRGEPPGLRRALSRSIVKLWGPIAFGVADLVPLPSFANAAIGLAWLAGSALVLVGRKVALHDRLAGTSVVYAILDP